ncbi:type II secretion system F family protein [Oceanobacter kriegii]|uniref:type II secretion system F family protein n=1 Tax=Oceanobacter kriegii TaxID=64972 RepID=UPI00041ECB1A|nr:type II secretion system F family protein [Oceanobacter kriegii]
MNNQWTFGAGLILLGIGLLLLRWQLAGPRNPLLRRLATDNDSVESSDHEQSGQTANAPLAAWLQTLAQLGHALAGSDTERAKLRNLLHMAGFHRPQACGLFMCVKTLGGLLGAVALALLLMGPQQLFSLAGFAFAALGYFAGSTSPEAYLKWRAAQRGERLARAVPDALDLMVICAEAGLPLGRILAVVARELRIAAPELAQELNLTLAELNIANDRSKALQQLAQRTRVKEIESMVSTLIQAEAYGTPLSQALRTISDDSRKTLMLGLEEKAGKLPAQMSVPLMTLILPPIVVVMGAPALVRLIRMLAA